MRQKRTKLPDQKALQQAVSLIDFRNIEINVDSITLKSGVQPDLGEDASKPVLKQYRAQAIFLYQNGKRSAFPEE